MTMSRASQWGAFESEYIIKAESNHYQFFFNENKTDCKRLK